MVDAWESLQDEYQRTAVVLDHFDEEINGGREGGIVLSDGSRRRVKTMLLAGGDLIQSMGEPGVWATQDVSSRVVFQYLSKVSMLTFTPSFTTFSANMAA
jgi:nicotinic acid mononucleotide adenylyltransferase